MQEELDEFTAYRLKRIAEKFCTIYKEKGRKIGSVYLNKQNIKKEHYVIVRTLINECLAEMGLSL